MQIMTKDSPQLRAALDAIRAREPKQLASLLDAHPGLISERTDERFSDTLLHFAAKENDVVAVQMLLERGADIECWTYATPLHAAAGFRSVESLEILIAAGAKVDPGRVDTGDTPLGYAILHGAAREADLLVRHGAEVDALWLAAGVGDLECMAEFFDADESLHDSAYQGRVVLLEYGDYDAEPPDDTDSEQFVLDEALIAAAMCGRVAAASDLVRRGANPSGIGYVGNALHWAIYFEWDEMVRYLLYAGADPTIKDRVFDGDATGWATHTERPDFIAFWA